MSEVQVEQKTYQMPPQDGIAIAHFLTVADVERSLRFYEARFLKYHGNTAPKSLGWRLK